MAEVDLNLWQLGTSAKSDSILKRCALLMAQLSERCSNLPMDAESAIIALNQFDDLLPKPPPESNFVCVLTGNLSCKSFVASELMKSVRGPRSDLHKMRAVIAIKAEFERTGLQATHNSNDTAGHTGVGTSPFDKFVRQFFKDVDPVDTQRRSIEDAIAFACRRGRQSAQGSKLKSAEGRESEIANMLIAAGVTNLSPDS